MGEAVSNSLPLNIVTLFIPVLFYFLGLSSNLEQFKILLEEKKSVLYGLGIQLLLLPLIGLLISEVFSNISKQGEVSTLFVYCNQRDFCHLQAAYQQISVSADRGEFLLCLVSFV